MNEEELIATHQPILDKVSPTFCLAKWHHVTLYLQTGQTHSCYHPPPHNIPLAEVMANPSALHNTQEKKIQRLEMLNGGKPEGCKYCWDIEAMGPDYISDRHVRSTSIYTPERLKEIQDNDWDFNVTPEYVEISFGNECNFKCGYCHPRASSRFLQEIKKEGVYEKAGHRCDIDWFDVYDEETNPYVKAWWKWWPELRKTLHILRITGGEPLLHKSTYRVLKKIERDPMPDLELNVNSNLGVKEQLVDEFCELVEKLKTDKKIERFKLFTSVDTWNERAEYIRYGLDLKLYERNLLHYLDHTSYPVTFMITFNLFCVTTFKTLLDKILEWRSKYPDRIRFDVSHLLDPVEFDMNILPKDEFMPYMHDSLQHMKDTEFSNLEVENFKRIVDLMGTSLYDPEKLTDGRNKFFFFFAEYDRRRNINLVNTFPELTDFWNLCRNGN